MVPKTKAMLIQNLGEQKKSRKYTVQVGQDNVNIGVIFTLKCKNYR